MLLTKQRTQSSDLPLTILTGNGSRYCRPGWSVSGGNASTTVAAGESYFQPCFIGDPIVTFDRIGIRIQTAGAGGTLARLGLYSAVAGVPANLIADFGTVVTDASGFNETIISHPMPRGLAFLNVVYDGAPGVRGPSDALSASFPVVGTAATGSSADSDSAILRADGRSADVAGGLPSTAPPIDGVNRMARAFVVLRIAA